MKTAADKKILIVDDEAGLRGIIGSFFRVKGFQTAEAGDGLEAMERIREERPDVVLLDINMPIMDGLTFLSKVKEDPSMNTVPVIILSARTESKDVEKGIGLGAQFYLEKPISFENLNRCVQVVLQ